MTKVRRHWFGRVVVVMALFGFGCVDSSSENKDRLNDDELGSNESTLIHFDKNGCTPGAPCGAGGGDCDNDADCTAGNICGNNNGTEFGTYWWWDICVPNGCAGCDDGPCGACSSGEALGSNHYCTTAFPCSADEGDCDNDGHCQGGLTCFADNGHGFQFNDWTDVCIPGCSNDNPPNANAGFPYTITAGQDLTLLAGNSSDPDENCDGGNGDRIVLYEWRLGAGGSWKDAVSTNSTVVVPWGSLLNNLGTGAITGGVRLRVHDQAGNTDEHQRPLTINPPAPL